MTLMFLAWENMWMGLSLANVMKAEGWGWKNVETEKLVRHILGVFYWSIFARQVENAQ